MSTAPKPLVLFLCTGNSCRSQMAEGFTRALLGERVDVASAGIDPSVIDRRAVAVMLEAGIDISGQESRGVRTCLEALAEPPVLVVTVCDSALESCPVLPGVTRSVHVPFEDPPRLARGADEERARAIYRRVRDEIHRFVTDSLPALL